MDSGVEYDVNEIKKWSKISNCQEESIHFSTNDCVGIKLLLHLHFFEKEYYNSHSLKCHHLKCAQNYVLQMIDH